MRLSLSISSLTAGGAERVMTTLANAWTDRGHEVSLFTTHDAGREPHFPLAAGIRRSSVDPGSKGPLKQLAIIRALGAALRASRPDVVVSFLNYTNVLTLAASRGQDYPVVVSERLDPRVVDIGPAWSMLRRVSYRRATRLIAQTTTAARLYENLTPGRVRVIPNPVQMPPAGPLVQGAPPATAGGTIIAIGRLHPQKGFDLALRALALLDRRYAAWRLVVLGEGPARKELESLRDQLGLGDRVLFPGLAPDPWPWLSQAQVFLMSSRSEGFPNALCEAMAAGLPVISTDCPSGPAEIITPEVDGLLVPAGDPGAIATALERLLSSPELRASLAAAAPAVAQRYSLESVLAAWDRVLAEVAQAKVPAHD